MKITKDMTFREALQIFPQAGAIMSMKGMGCVGCMVAHMETIEEGCAAHGVDVDELIDEINELMEKSKQENQDQTQDKSQNKS